MKKKKISLILAAALAMLFMFAGCSSYSTKGVAVRETTAGHNAYAAKTEDYADNEAEAGEDSVSGMYGARKASDSAPAAAANGSGRATQSAGVNKTQTQDQTQNQANIDPTKGRLLIRNVQITAQTTDFDNVRKSVEDKVKELGGYIENSGISGTGKAGSLRSANYTIRVPADGLDALITAVGSNCSITSTNESTTDVTLSYVDTKAKLESLRVEQKQLTELLSQAKDLDTIIVLQERLTTVRYQIESAESTLRVLENQVSFSTLSLRIKEVMEVKPQEEPHIETYGEKVVKTFKNSLKAIGEFFQGLFLVLVALSPVVVPLIIITAVALIIVFSTLKKKRARRAAMKAAAVQGQNAGAQIPAPQAQVSTEEKKEEKK